MSAPSLLAERVDRIAPGTRRRLTAWLRAACRQLASILEPEFVDDLLVLNECWTLLLGEKR